MRATQPSLQTVTIADNGDLSGAASLYDQSLVALLLPEAWIAADVTFEVSNDDSTYGPLYYQGAEYKPIAGAVGGEAVSLEPSAFFGWKYVKVRSGTDAAAVTQTGGPLTINLYFKPV